MEKSHFRWLFWGSRSAGLPLEVVLSSSTPKRYLEPSELFIERTFEFAQCRFFSHWSLTIMPGGGGRTLKWKLTLLALLVSPLSYRKRIFCLSRL
jgi:hypothetical protein